MRNIDPVTGEIVRPLVRTKFNYDMDEASRESALECIQVDQEGYDGKTQQHFKEESDINTIVNHFIKHGQLPENHRIPEYIDYEGVFDFQSAMNTMMAAEKSFMELPAKLRANFNNSPQEYLEFCTNPANVDEMHKLGLLRPDYKKPEPPAPAPAPAPQPAPAGTSTST